MLQIFKELDLPVPEGVTVSVSSRVFTVKGPRGSLTKVSIPSYADIRHFRKTAAEAGAFRIADEDHDWGTADRSRGSQPSMQEASKVGR